MESSNTPTTESPQLVSGQSAFWILVTLAAAAVAQPSTCSRRKGRNLFGGRIDLFRCVPVICLFDGIVDLIALGRAIRHEILLRTGNRGNADRERRRLPPLKPNVATVMLTISILGVLPQTIKVLSMRGIPWTQFCASLYFFAITTTLAIEFSRLKTDGYFPDLEVQIASLFTLFTLLKLLTFVSQVLMEAAIWYSISLPVTTLLHSDDRGFGKFMLKFMLSSIGIVPVILDLGGLAYEKAPRFKLVIASALLMMLMILFCALLVASGIMSAGSLFESTEHQKAPLKKSLSWAERLIYAIGLIICVGVVSILVAKTISAVGHLIASSGHAQTSSPDTTENSTSEPIDSSSGDQPAESAAARSSRTHSQSCSRMLMVWLESWMLWTLPFYSWLIRFLTPESDGSTIVAITIFNLATSVCYYLVWFDGTGTSSPDWVSILG